MYALHIRDCSNFSFVTLRQMVEKRNVRVTETNSGYMANFTLTYVTVSGRRPSLGPDDRKWLAFPQDEP